MIKPEDEVIVNLNTSCTLDEAVAKMLGWLQGSKRKRIINIDEYGISEDQFPYLPTLEHSLEEHLTRLRDAVQQKYLKAVEAFSSVQNDDERNTKGDEACQKEEAVKKFDDLIEKAYRYKLDIEHELNKGKSSVLVIDRKITKKSGDKHITIISLCDWAFKRYGISIDPYMNQHEVTNNQQSQPTVQRRGNTPENDDWPSTTKKENLYITFAFLVEAFADAAPKYKHVDKPNVSQIAEVIAKCAKDANNGENMPGISVESIKDRIEESFRIKKSKLPSNTK